MDLVRTVIIGFGGMGKQYADMIYDGEIDRMPLVGICCRNEAGQAEIREKYKGVAIYSDVTDVFAHAEDFDAVVIVTPHATHVEIGKMAAAAGKHILVDKPAGISTKEVRELKAAHDQAGTSFAMIFNVRINASFFKMKQMIDEGRVGRLMRAVWVCNAWYRSPAYHNSAPWRSTWKGEHGGLLINQCQHLLDVWQWLLGMPDSVYASIDYGKYNDFQVDDSLDLQFFYNNGIHGTFISASGENPGVNRLEIWGTKGRLCIEDNERITFDENLVSTVEFAETNTEIYGRPEHRLLEIPVEPWEKTGYQKLFGNFADHILDGTPLLADGDDGIRTLMLANGAYLSSWLSKRVDYPIDDELYAKMLDERVKNSEKILI